MIKKTKLIPIVCGICATTATVIPAVGCTCSFVTNKLELTGGNTRLTTSINTAGKDSTKWVLKNNDEEIPYEQWDSTEIKSLDDGDVSGIIELNNDHIIQWKEIDVAKAYTFVIVVKTVDGLSCESEPIVLDVNEDKPDVFTLEGGNTYIEATYQNVGTDTGIWVLKKGITPVEGATYAVVGDITDYSIVINNGQVSWNASETTKSGPATFSVVAYVENVEKARVSVTLNIQPQVIYTLTGGSISLTAQAGVAGGDAGTWTLLKNGGEVKDDVTYTIQGTKPKGVDIKTGVVTWTNEIETSANPYTFTIAASIAGKVVQTSPQISLTVNPADVYQLVGGSVSLTAQAGVAGADDGAWQLKENGRDVEGETISIVGTPPTGVQIDNKTGKVSWGTNVAVGSEMVFNVQTTYKSITTQSPDIHLYVNPADKYVVTGGSTLLTGKQGSIGHDATPWTLLKNGAEISTGLTYSFRDAERQELTIPGLSIPNGIVTWNDEIEAIEYSFYVGITYNSTLYLSPAEITLNIEPQADTPIIIDGDDVVVASHPQILFEALEYVSGNPVEVEWSVATSAGWEGTAPIFDEDTDGRLITGLDSKGIATITATSTATGNAVATKTITVQPPYIDSDGIWGKIIDPTNPGATVWAEFDAESLSSTSGMGGIEYTPLGRTPVRDPLPKETFDTELFIGDNVTAIRDNFLHGCIIFNSPITFTENSKCVLIGDNFIAGDAFASTPVIMAFNQTLVLPDSIVEIGDDFLAACSTFNNGSTATVPKITPLHMPTSLEKIGDEFLNSCRAFNQNLTISETVQSVGNEFMQNCDNMVSTVTINTDAINFKTDGGLSLSFASDTEEEPLCHSTGITIAGSAAGDIIGKFGELQYTTDGNWRLLHQ